MGTTVAGIYPLCRASLSRSPLCGPSQGHHVLKPSMPAASRAVPTLPLGAWGTCTHHTSNLPEYTLLTLMHTTHMVHVTHSGWAPACVGACLGTGRAGRQPCNSSHWCKAHLLLHPAYTNVLEETHMPLCRDTHPMAAPWRSAVHPYSCELQFTHPSPLCTPVNTHTHKHTCATHPQESMFSHQNQRHTDKEMDMGSHNRYPTPHQCHPCTRSPEHLPAPLAAHSPASPAGIGVPKQPEASPSSRQGPWPDTYWPVTTLQ